MRIASHNTFTYLPVRHWWMKPFAFMARCQRVDFGEQWLAGARLFDLRVRFDKEGNYIICHGLMEYECEPTFLDNIFRYMDYGRFRVVLETNKPDMEQEEHFYAFCYRLEHRYKKLIFFGGNNRTDWGCKNPVYEFTHGLEDLDDKYSSTTNLFPFRWMARLDDLCPILYASLHNRKNIEKGTSHDWLMLDFVDIQ